MEMNISEHVQSSPELKKSSSFLGRVEGSGMVLTAITAATSGGVALALPATL